jgi:uncharacterized Zn-binding protein involved in type VI secretion
MTIRSLAAAALLLVSPATPLLAQSQVTTTTQDFLKGHLENLQIQATGGGVLSLAPQALPGAWQAGDKLPKPLSHHGMVVSGNRVFVIGGKSLATGAYIPDVYGATLDATTGVPKGWTAMKPLPAGRGYHGVAEYNGTIYVVGGDAPSASVDVRPEVFYSQVQADGTLSDWKETTPLPADTSTSTSAGKDLAGVVAYRGCLYLVSGATQEVFAGTPLALSAPINADGTIGDWRIKTMPTDAARLGAPLVAAGGRLYSLGGERMDASANRLIVGEVWRSNVEIDGTVVDWLLLPTGLPAGRSSNQNSGAALDGTLFTFGGAAPTPDGGFVRSDTVYAGALDTDGGVPNWQESTPLPTPVLLGAAATVPPVGASAGTILFSGGEDQTGTDVDGVYAAAMTPAAGGALAYSGSFESPIVALQGASVSQISWVGAGAGTVGVQYRATDATGKWAAWSAPVTISPVAVSLPAGATAFQYLVVLTGDGKTSPTVDSITVTTSGGGGTDKAGDLDGNGKVNIADVVYGLKVVAGLTTLTADQRARLVRVGDAYPAAKHDGKFAIGDVVQLLKFIAGLNPTYPS